MMIAIAIISAVLIGALLGKCDLDTSQIVAIWFAILLIFLIAIVSIIVDKLT